MSALGFGCADKDLGGDDGLLDFYASAVGADADLFLGGDVGLYSAAFEEGSGPFFRAVVYDCHEPFEVGGGSGGGARGGGGGIGGGHAYGVVGGRGRRRDGVFRGCKLLNVGHLCNSLTGPAVDWIKAGRPPARFQAAKLRIFFGICKLKWEEGGKEG